MYLFTDNPQEKWKSVFPHTLKINLTISEFHDTHRMGNNHLQIAHNCGKVYKWRQWYFKNCAKQIISFSGSKIKYFAFVIHAHRRQAHMHADSTIRFIAWSLPGPSWSIQEEFRIQNMGKDIFLPHGILDVGHSLLIQKESPFPHPWVGTTCHLKQWQHVLSARHCAECLTCALSFVTLVRLFLLSSPFSLQRPPRHLKFPLQKSWGKILNLVLLQSTFISSTLCCLLVLMDRPPRASTHLGPG